MKLQANHSLIDKVEYCPSPHCDERSDANEISLLVLHNISLPPREYGQSYIQDFFQGKLDISAHPYFRNIAELRVSAHLLIKRSGEIVQFVPFSQRAWHAGVSSFQGRSKCNDYSIGIEIEGCDDEAYTREQYTALVEVTQLIMFHYPKISLGRVIGHCDIAPGRKTDPGPSFDWANFRVALWAALHSKVQGNR
jgi:AmpD protein